MWLGEHIHCGQKAQWKQVPHMWWDQLILYKRHKTKGKDHEVIPCSSKICDWSLNLSRDHFGLHQGKKWKSDHGTWGPQKACFHAYIIHCHDPTGFAVGEAKEVLLLQLSRDYDKEMPFFFFFSFFFLPNFFSCLRGKKGRRGRRSFMKKIPKTTFFGHIKKFSICTFGCMVTSLGPHSVYT